MLRIATAIAITAAAFASMPASAATVTQCGPNICYEYDDAQAAVALFGLPTLVGNSLVLLPPDFRAESSDGEGIVTANANFTFTNVYSLDGVSEIENIVISEFGDYEIDGGDRVEGDLLLTVVNNNGLFPQFGSSSDSFDALGDSGGLQTWTMQANFNAADEFDLAANSVLMTVQNGLLAETNNEGEYAWIQKVISITGVVPIPAAAWLFISGLGAMFGFSRARRS